VSAIRIIISRFWSFAPVKLPLALILMFLSSISSSFSILLIIPLLAAIGIAVSDHNTANNSLAESVNKLLNGVGIDPTLESILLLYLFLITLSAAIRFCSAVLSTSLRQSFVMQQRNELAHALFYTQWRYLSQARMSDFARLLGTQVQTVSSCLVLLLSLVSSVIIVVIYTLLSISITPLLTLIAAVCGLLLVSLVLPINKKIAVSGRLDLHTNRKLHRTIFDNLTSLKIIKSFRAEELFLDELNSSNKVLEAQQTQLTKFNSLTGFINVVGTALIFALLFYSSIKWLNVPVTNLLVVLFIFSRLMPQISSIQNTVQNLIHQIPTYQDVLSKVDELSVWAEPASDKHQAINFDRELKLVDVSYQHIDANAPVLSGFNCTIPCLSTVAIVGPSGIGKSTLADIVAGLVTPDNGNLLVDDVSISKQNRFAWRESVAYVTQDVFLFHDTVRANLDWVYGVVRQKKQHPSSQLTAEQIEEKLWQALKLAAADELVRSLPQGLDTTIGDRGTKLSGGERQRLALARALLSKPEVLILDEATSALDRNNELKIRDALRNLEGQLTIIIIAHNKTTIEHASKTIDLERPKDSSVEPG